MEIYSIGFTQKSAGEFFGALKAVASSACSMCG